MHGGAGLRFYRYLPYFYKNNIETTVVCGTPKRKKFTEDDLKANWKDFQDGTLVNEDVVERARILKYKIPGSGSKERSKILLEKVIDICADKETKPDVVHIIAPMPYAVVDQLKKIKKLDVKLVYSHTIAKDFSNNVFVKLIQRWKVKYVLKQYNHIIVQSNALKQIIEDTNPDSNISVIPNGVDTEKFSPVKNQAEKAQLRDSLGLPTVATIITLVGAVHPRKGTDLLIEAWSQLIKDYPKLNLLLIGPRYDQSRTELLEFKKKIERLIAQSNKSENIHFVGQSDKVDSYLKASDMFVFPSKREGMPNAVLEAMASGVPVVLTPFVGLSEELGVVDQHYLLADRSGCSLKENILQLLSDPDACDQFSTRARKWILDNMTIKRSVEKYIEVFQC